MKPYAVVAALLLSITMAAAGADVRTVSSPRGGVASGSVTQQGNRVSGQASVTSAKGRTVSATGSATYHAASGTVDGEASVTGPQGATHGGTAEAGNGSATVTGNDGRTVTSNRPQD